jgi:large subunit ribosomal protein L25
MDSVNLSADSRVGTGKGINRKLRATGKMPAVIYGAGGAAEAISVDPAALESAFAGTGNPNTIVKIDIGGRVRSCMVKEAQRHPLHQNLVHVDFYEVQDDQKINVTVRVRTQGTSAGQKAGGSLRIIARDLKVACTPATIPAFVDVDVTSLEIGKYIRASAVPAPAGTTLLFARDFNVVTVVGKSTEKGA